MGTIILIIWALYMLYAYVKSFKNTYGKYDVEYLKEPLAKIEEVREDDAINGQVITLFIGAAVSIASLFYAVFWMIVASSFSNLLVIGYCIFIIMRLAHDSHKIYKLFNGEIKITEMKPSVTEKITYPISFGIIISFIIVLLGRLI